MTPERKAELYARLEKAYGRPLPKPKVVVRDGEVKRDANVHVSRADPNAATCKVVSGGRLVEVRVADLLAERLRSATVPEGKRRLGIDEVGGELKGYWTLVDGEPQYVEVVKEPGVVSEYNPFSRERL